MRSVSELESRVGGCRHLLGESICLCMFAGFISFSVDFAGGIFPFWLFLRRCCPVKIFFAGFEILERFGDRDIYLKEC